MASCHIRLVLRLAWDGASNVAGGGVAPPRVWVAPPRVWVAPPRVWVAPPRVWVAPPRVWVAPPGLGRSSTFNVCRSNPIANGRVTRATRDVLRRPTRRRRLRHARIVVRWLVQLGPTSDPGPRNALLSDVVATGGGGAAPPRVWVAPPRVWVAPPRVWAAPPRVWVAPAAGSLRQAAGSLQRGLPDIRRCRARTINVYVYVNVVLGLPLWRSKPDPAANRAS
jgi:hypothetical protein